MLNSKVEKAIFIVIYIALFVFVGYWATQYKANYLPINKDLTPEQIIESEYNEIKRDNLHYNYVVNDDFLITCIKMKTGYSTVHTAFKNDISGFMFDVPGNTVGSFYEIKDTYTILKDDIVLSTAILKHKTKYAISIGDLFENRDIDVYCNNEVLHPISLSDSHNKFWVVTMPDLSEDTDIYCVYQGDTYHIVNNHEIEKLFGGRS